MDQFSKFNISTIQIRPVVDIPEAPYEWEDFTPYSQEYREILYHTPNPSSYGYTKELIILQF